MNITELKGEKTIKALVKRVLDQPSKKGARKTTESEMEAALLRLNPHLRGIADLEAGTPVLLPEKFPLARDESSSLAGDAAELLQGAEAALKSASAALADSVEQAGQQAERVRTWLKGDGPKEMLRGGPGRKETFSSAAAAAKTLRKEQTALAEAEEKALGEVQAELARFLENSRR